MKLIKRFALTAAVLAVMSPVVVQAEEGGLEISGAIDTLAGWQHDDANANATTSCPAGSFACNSSADAGVGGGQLGDLRGLTAARRDTFNFYVDQVEVDLSKTLGENIRIRADLDFRGPSTLGAGAAGMFGLEQGYVTANIPAGNGIELLVGRFNAPIGLESVDRQDNVAVSFTNLYRFVRPHNLTGAKFYYAFNDAVDFHLYAANNLKDTVSTGIGATTAESAMPAVGFRLGFNWGDGETKSSIGLSGAGSAEHPTNNTHYSFLGDLDINWAISENFSIGGEFIYRQDNVLVLGAKNNKAMAAQLLAAYNFNESWGGYVRGGWLHDINPAGVYTGNDQQIYDWTVGFSYQIAEGAKVKLEYRGDYFADAIAANSLSHGAAAEFAYHF